MAAGHVTSQVKHTAGPLATCTEEIKKGNVAGEKISGILNPSDIGTKPLPTSTLHRHARFLRGQRYYPAPSSLHGKLAQIEIVNQRINDIENNKSDGLLSLQQYNNITSVYDNKDNNKLPPQPKQNPK